MGKLLSSDVCAGRMAGRLPPAEVSLKGDVPADGLLGAARFWGATSIALGIMLSQVDVSIANLALPTLARQFQVSASSSIWVVNSYQLAVTISLLPLAALGEILGYRRVYCAGIVLFTLASLGSALSGSLPMLVVMRALQGFGGAGMMSVNTALVRFIYPRRLVGNGFAMNLMMGSASAVLGPSLASLILSVASWPWLFAVNVPLGIFALVIGLTSLPQTPRDGRRFDLGSAALNAITFGLLINGIEAVGHLDSRTAGLVELAFAAAACWWLVRRQIGRTNPLLPVDLLRQPLFAISIVAAVLCFVAQAMGLVTLPFYLEGSLGFSRGETGLLMTPWPLAAMIAAPFSGRLSDRCSPTIACGIGQGFMLCGLVSLACLPSHAPALWNIVWRTSLCGVGFGLFVAPNNRVLFMVAPPKRSGGVSGLQASGRLLGQTFGTALAALLFGMLGAARADLLLFIAGGFSGLSCIVSVSRMNGWRRLTSSEC